MNDNVSSGCLLPVMQAVITGVMVALVTLGASLTFELSDHWPLALGIGSTACLGWWMSSITQWRRSVYYEPEPVYPVGPIIDHKQLSPPAQIYRLEVKSENGRKIQIAELDGVSPDRLQQLARGLMNGASFSEENFSGTGRPFSRAELRRIRSIFLARGWLRWKNDNAVNLGVELSPVGHAVVKHLALGVIEAPPLPTESYNPVAWQ